MTNTHQLVMSLSEPQNILTVQNRKEFRLWLEAYHTTEKECWLKVKRGRPYGDMHFWYIDAVEEALCFGWIDSTIKRIDGVVQQRFTPRTKKSTWTAIIDYTRKNIMYGEWNDNGRLLEE